MTHSDSSLVLHVSGTSGEGGVALFPQPRSNFLGGSRGAGAGEQQPNLLLERRPSRVMDATTRIGNRSLNSEDLPYLGSLEVPDLRWPKKASPVLTVRVKELLQNLWAIVVSKAMQREFPAENTEVTTTYDPESRVSKAVLAVSTSANMIQTLAFWDSLQREFGNWESQFNSEDRILLRRDISLHFHWDVVTQ